LIVDEMITGLRWHIRGAQHVHGLDPDLSTWGKALANGFSVSALAGRRDIMRLGDLEQTDHKRVFLMSTTHGGETHGLAAAIATLDVYAREPVIERLNRAGERLRAGFQQTSAKHGLEGHVSAMGRACNLLFSTLDADGKPSQPLRTLFLQETIKRGVIMPSLVVSYSHTDADIDQTIEAIDGAMEIYRRALNDGAEKYLVGRPSQPVYRTYNQPQASQMSASSPRR
jgi:glutamate-1-semialdehyde 2,1-aminomutase